MYSRGFTKTGGCEWTFQGGDELRRDSTRSRRGTLRHALLDSLRRRRLLLFGLELGVEGVAMLD